MNRNYFECHVTIAPQFKDFVQMVADKHKFKTSFLEGDIVMGDAKLMYCTCNDKDEDNITKRMNSLVTELLANKVTVLREKIEEIKWDKRYDVTNINS